MSWIIALTLLAHPVGGGYPLPDRLHFRLSSREHRRETAPPVFFWGRW